MRRKCLTTAFVILFAAMTAYAQAENVIEGLWICDYSTQGGPLVELTLIGGEYTADITTPDQTMTWTGTYEFAENVITFSSETDTIEGTYDPENDTLSVTYEGVLYVFQRTVEGEPEEK